MSPVSGESKGVGVQGPGFPSPLNMEIYITNLLNVPLEDVVDFGHNIVVGFFLFFFV